MVNSFETWLEKFISPFPLSDRNDLMRKMVLQYSDELKVTSEDVSRHKRIVTPGDYRVKLRQETIAILTQKFDDILGMLGY